MTYCPFNIYVVFKSLYVSTTLDYKILYPEQSITFQQYKRK